MINVLYFYNYNKTHDTMIGLGDNNITQVFIALKSFDERLFYISENISSELSSSSVSEILSSDIVCDEIKDFIVFNMDIFSVDSFIDLLVRIKSFKMIESYKKTELGFSFDIEDTY